MPFSESTILQLHSILYRYMPQPGGHWKATNNDIIERHPGGSSRVWFRPVGTIERGRGANSDRVRSEIGKRNLPFSISDIGGACPGVSRDMVRLVLRTMKAEGLIASTGKGRGAKWVGLTTCLQPQGLPRIGDAEGENKGGTQ